MKKYKFHQDIKLTMWQRQFFSIEAENEDEAKAVAMQFIDEQVSSSDYFDTLVDLTDTEEIVKVSESHPGSTIQLFRDGEKTPFAQNGQSVINDYNPIVYENLMQQVNAWLKNGIDCKTVVLGNTTYYICHIQNRLRVVAVKGRTEAVRYLFVQSWTDIVASNDTFKQEMLEYVVKKKIKEVPAKNIVNWMNGKYKELDEVPFDMDDFIAVWSYRAAKEKCRPTILLGYQIADRNGNIAEGFNAAQVIKDIRKAEEWVAEACKNEPDKKGFYIHPVYVGEIKEPVLI